MHDNWDTTRRLSRRAFLEGSSCGLGRIALASLLLPEVFSQGAEVQRDSPPLGLADLPHFAPTAKRVIYLFQSGGPSHVDLFDYSPVLDQQHGNEIPESVLGTQRITTMTSGQSSFPVVKPLKRMRQCGRHGTWISDLLPHTQSIADEITIVKSVNTEAINHDPAITFINTGSQQLGHASLGSWLSYGLGSENANLPAYVVLLSQGTGKNPGQPLFSRLWGNGYLPSTHQGVQLRPGANPVLYLSNPPGISSPQRRRMLDELAELNRMQAEQSGDPEIQTRIEAYEMAFRMQSSAPELVDLNDEPESTFDLYGDDARRPGTFAANCLLARRMAERGVRFVQLFHRGWDQHTSLARHLPRQCKDVDQGSAALIHDLKERGLLEETLVIWGGEFGRTIFSQGEIGSPGAGRDHHGRCFTMWLAGGGVKAGFEYGKTDDFAYNIVEDPVHIRDLNATILRCLGIDHRRFSFKFQGLEQRITGVEQAHVINGILS